MIATLVLAATTALTSLTGPSVQTGVQNVTRMANLLAVEQVADCASTHMIMSQYGGYEINPISRALRADKSLPLCLVEAAAWNLGLRKFHSPFLLRLGLGIEGAAVLHNVLNETAGPGHVQWHLTYAINKPNR